MKDKLPDLPDSHNEFWKDAETYKVKLDKSVCDHRLIYNKITEGITAECTKCHAGWILSPGAEIKNNHIYLHGELVI